MMHLQRYVLNAGARLPKEAGFFVQDAGARQTDQTEQQEEEMTVEEQPETEEDGTICSKILKIFQNCRLWMTFIFLWLEKIL